MLLRGQVVSQILHCRSIHASRLQRAKISVLRDLQERSLLEHYTGNATTGCDRAPSVYSSFDTKSASLHIGHLPQIVTLKHFREHGHNTFTLLRDATSRLDKSGSVKSKQAQAENSRRLARQLQHLFGAQDAYKDSHDLAHPPGEHKIVHNSDWYNHVTFLRFMTEVGRQFQLSRLLSRYTRQAGDQATMPASTGDMSFNEFTYQLLQAYDFWVLYKERGVLLQVGGSDQYGNITAGIDLISRLNSSLEHKKSPHQVGNTALASREAFGLTVPLLTTPTGEKFGKSAGNAIWLDSEMTSPADLYTYLFKVPDEALAGYLLRCTLVPVNVVGTIMAKHQETPKLRLANRLLASELVTFVHGKDALEALASEPRISSLLATEAQGSCAKLVVDDIVSDIAKIPPATGLIEEMQQRSMLKTTTSPNLAVVTGREKISLYCGVDPTAQSLHLGNLMTLIPVFHFYIRGHHPFILVGGATGQVGDPAGKSAERERMQQETLARNVDSLTRQLHQFFKHATSYAESHGYQPDNFGKLEVVNNAQWYEHLTFIDFLEEVGTNVRTARMLARDSVRNRLCGVPPKEAGDAAEMVEDQVDLTANTSYSEFSGPLLEAFDAWMLYRDHDVQGHVGVSRQKDDMEDGVNLTAKLMKSLEAEQSKETILQPFGVTLASDIQSSNAKTIWLDAELTSPFDLYQHFVRTPDAELGTGLARNTLLPLTQVRAVMAQHAQRPQARVANRLLAAEVTRLVHGERQLARVRLAARILFPRDFALELDAGGAERAEPLSAAALLEAFAGDPCLHMLTRRDVIGKRCSDVLQRCRVVKSGKEARQLAKNGGLQHAGKKITDASLLVQEDWLIDDSVLLLRVGRSKFAIVHVE